METQPSPGSVLGSDEILRRLHALCLQVPNSLHSPNEAAEVGY